MKRSAATAPRRAVGPREISIINSRARVANKNRRGHFVRLFSRVLILPSEIFIGARYTERFRQLGRAVTLFRAKLDKSWRQILLCRISFYFLFFFIIIITIRGLIYFSDQ